MHLFNHTGIKPSSVRNFTILGFVINEEGVDEKGDKGTIDFSLSWIVPEIEAGGIAMYRIGFGIPQIPNLGTRDIPVSCFLSSLYFS